MNSVNDYRVYDDDYQRGRNEQYEYTGASRSYIVAVVEDEPADEFENNEGQVFYIKFQDKSLRMLFVRKVLGAVSLQFLACTLFIALCQFESSTNAFFRDGYGHLLGVMSSICWFILFIAIACCKVGYGKPNVTNISLMIISTVLLSVFLGAYTVRYDLFSILLAAATTLGVTQILCLITFNTKVDITSKGMWIFGAMLALFMFTFIASIFVWTGSITLETGTNISLVLSGLFAMLYAVLILYHLKLIVGGGQYTYGEDDWLLASITLFYDIVLFFLEILQITRMFK